MNITIPDSCTFWFNSFALAIIVCVVRNMLKVDIMYKTFPKICESLTRISEILVAKKITKDNVFITTSPLHLTDYGLKIVNESGVPEFYESNKKYLFKLIKSHHPKTAADIDESLKIIMFMSDKDFKKFSLLKTYAYQNAIPIAALLFACAIYVRDKVFEEPCIKKLIIKEQ